MDFKEKIESLFSNASPEVRPTHEETLIYFGDNQRQQVKDFSIFSKSFRDQCVKALKIKNVEVKILQNSLEKELINAYLVQKLLVEEMKLLKRVVGDIGAVKLYVTPSFMTIQLCNIGNVRTSVANMQRDIFGRRGFSNLVAIRLTRSGKKTNLVLKVKYKNIDEKDFLQFRNREVMNEVL
ncbi:hypothetical protein [Halobacteriovorax sp. DA5]|uniref:hypothetical protein n=1 Tax=Halobacteriovorax sp. DA5 TaxID=2067553 RepID=UPI000CD222AC|nr:hypothetical protein [Halobacteriovorax sp. DA5]POB14866.1 hypothetical protein C0Z22_00400 [Halobacteriovorax sp. DA5]